MRLFRIFYLTFFSFFLTLFLLINLDMYVTMVSGVNPLGLPYVNKWDFNNYYFGFSSILMSFTDLGDLVHFNELLSSMTEFFNIVTLYIVPQMDGTTDIMQIVAFIVNLLIGPISLLLSSLKMLAFVIANVIDLFTWFSRLLGGYYNMPLPVNTISITNELSFLNPLLLVLGCKG